LHAVDIANINHLILKTIL